MVPPEARLHSTSLHLTSPHLSFRSSFFSFCVQQKHSSRGSYPLVVCNLVASLIIRAIVYAADYGYGYAPNPEQEDVSKPNRDDQVKPKDYTERVPKPNLDLPKPGDLPKPKPDGYIADPKTALDKRVKPKLDEPKQGIDTEKPLPICIEGLVLCKTGRKFIPIKEALARITCVGNDENGYEKSVSILSPETDEKDYFFATLTSASNLFSNLKLTECRAYIENSPSSICKVPTDINDGMSGALLDAFRILKEKQIKLYRVQPLVFTPESTPDGY